MEIIINDKDVESLLEQTSEITEIDYSDNTLDCLCAALQDMLIEHKHLKEEMEDFKQEVEDNYRPLTQAEMLGSAYYAR